MRQPEFTNYDREVLYEQVWAEPVRDLAKRYGVSDVALAKACRRLSVPLPGRGYWAKRRGDGRTPPRPPLPEVDGPKRVPVSGALQRLPLAPEEEKVPVPEVRVPEGLRRPHPLVVAARAALAEKHPLSPLAFSASKGCLDIGVSPEQRQRALRIMDALVKHLEATSGGVEVSRKPRDAWGNEEPGFVTEAIVGEERVGFALREKQRMHREPPSARDAARGWPWDRPTVSYLPSGRLELGLTSSRLEGIRRSWSDGKRQRLEDVLGEFVVGLGEAAARLAQIREEDRRLQLARLEAERRRAEAAERRRLEEERIARLIGEADEWSRATELRAYAQAGLRLLDEAARADDTVHARRADLEWLLEYADSVDPLLGHSA
jgi:hypothetical protein